MERDWGQGTQRREERHTIRGFRGLGREVNRDPEGDPKRRGQE